MLLTGSLLVAAALGLSTLTATVSISPRVVHESRTNVPKGWRAIRRAEPSTILPLRIGLAQSNLENIEAFLLDVSHPDSLNYGKHWSPQQVADTFRPSVETVDTVHEWLLESGLEAERVKLIKGGSWIQANVTIEEAEMLLGTEYYVYQFGDEEEGVRDHIACADRYHLPEHVSKHVELITPTLHFDVKHKRETHRLEVRDVSAKSVGQPGFGVSFPKTTGTTEKILAELDYCDEEITPDCLRALYNFYYEPVALNNSIAIAEYTPQGYVPSDLDLFFDYYSPIQVGYRPIFVSIDGGFIQTEYTGFDYNGESNLDLQYSMSLIGPAQNVTLYQAGDQYEGASFNNLLDALDLSYCTFEGGDDPQFDSTYPDPYYAFGSYEGPQDCGTVTPAYIMSTSYSYDEVNLTPSYMQRQCAEYAKLGLMGMTILYSSGDYGVAGYEGVCIDSDGEETTGGTVFSPSFPSGCPYVTSVGATQINPGSTVSDPESACEQVIYSGGGWSNVFAMPSYQQTAVESYLTDYPPPYPADIWNSTGTSRAFPDIAANGANYIVPVQGEFYLVYGTSCSAPVSAAIFSAVNDARLAQGKGPIGFINPTIYTASGMAAFNDIANGTNPGCGTNGFSSEPGWDPITGVGTPNFSKLLALFSSLP